MTVDSRTAPDANKKWGVWINENHLMFYGKLGDYWVTHRPRWEQSGQLTVLRVGVFGDEVLLGPLSRDDADFARSHLIEKGAAQAAVKVRSYQPMINEATGNARGRSR